MIVVSRDYHLVFDTTRTVVRPELQFTYIDRSKSSYPTFLLAHHGDTDVFFARPLANRDARWDLCTSLCYWYNLRRVTLNHRDRHPRRRFQSHPRDVLIPCESDRARFPGRRFLGHGLPPYPLPPLDVLCLHVLPLVCRPCRVRAHGAAETNRDEGRRAWCDVAEVGVEKADVEEEARVEGSGESGEEERRVRE